MPLLGSSSWPPFLQRYTYSARGAKAKKSSLYTSPEQCPISPHPRPTAAVALPSNSIPPMPTPTPTSSISRMPVELLMQIFALVPRMEFKESVREVNTAPPPRPTWIAIMQVCRRWRAIAADCKDFWTFVPLQASAYWVEVSLARSYPCPISFLVDFSSAQPDWYRRAALSALRAISRAREVHLQGSATATDLEFREEALRLLDVSSAPMLETFSVRGYTTRDFFLLSGNIFLRQVAAALHYLTLMFCDIHLSSPLFQAPLISLRLMNCYVKSPLDILGLLPHLRTLLLENIYGSYISHSSDVLSLPQLQHLELTNLSSVIAFLLQGILVPSSSSVSIMCTDYVDLDDPLDDLTLLHTITSNISPVLSAYLERAVGDGYVFPLLEVAPLMGAAKKTLVLLDRPSPDSRARQLRLSLIWAGTPKSTNLFSELLSTLPTTALQHIHTLRMRDTITPTLPPSSRAADARSRPSPFAAFHDKARDEAARGLLAILTQEELLPALRRISLQDVDFKHLDPDSLARVLVHRQRATAIYGAKIRLCLENCFIAWDQTWLRSIRHPGKAMKASINLEKETSKLTTGISDFDGAGSDIL
ncbi:hypothetical protein BJV74DRAFT_794955 [Russula compacta]|nr:hypothetical protein BJV74DRAFT_794955 [Russula compacta]